MLYAVGGLVRRGKREFSVTAKRRPLMKLNEVRVCEGMRSERYFYPIGKWNKFSTGLLQKAVSRFISETAEVHKTSAQAKARKS